MLQHWAISEDGFDQLKTDFWCAVDMHCVVDTDNYTTQHSHHGDGPITKEEKLFQHTSKTLEKIAGNAINLMQQMPPGHHWNEIIGQLSAGIKTSEVASLFKVGLSTIIQARKCSKYKLL